MDEQEYGRTVQRLSPARRAVFDVIAAEGPMTDEELVEFTGASRSRVIPRRSELARFGLVRGVGSKRTAAGGKTTIWEVVPAADVEHHREVAEQRGPRRQEILKWRLEDRVRVARALLRDRAVNEALQAPGEPGSRRTRARARQEMERDRRDRAHAIRQEEAAKGELVALLKVKDHLKKNIDTVREVGYFLDEEMEREAGNVPTRIPDTAWPQILELLEQSVDVSDEIYERIADRIGHAPRANIQIIDGSSPGAAPARPVKVVSPPAPNLGAITDG